MLVEVKSNVDRAGGSVRPDTLSEDTIPVVDPGLVLGSGIPLRLRLD